MESDDEAIYFLNCMEAPIDEETKLLKELELLTACVISDDCEMVLTAIPDDQIIMQLILLFRTLNHKGILIECPPKTHNGSIMQL
jgi:hypothetical protein